MVQKKKQSSYNRQTGIIPIGYIIVAIVLVIIVGTGIYVFQKNKQAPATLGTSQHVANEDPAASRLKNFYDCFESDGHTYYADSPNKCVAHGRVFSEPTRFTNDNVRDADKLPVGVRGQVFSDAAANFNKCGVSDNQGEDRLPVTQVLSVLGSDWTYIGLSCESSTNEIFLKQADGSWQRVSKTVGRPSCAVVGQYQIPKELFLSSTNPEDNANTCLKADNSVSQIPYTYKPSSTSETQTDTGAQ